MISKLSKIRRLINLYFNFIFQKTNIIIISISVVLIAIILLLIANPGYDYITYLKEYKNMHEQYISQSILIIILFNSVIATCLVINIIINSISFDCLFISYIKRKFISISKLIVLSIILLVLSIIEVIILYLIPIIIYPYFKIDNTIFVNILYIFSHSMINILFSVLFTTILSNIFVVMSYMFISLSFNIILTSIEDFSKIYRNVFPSLIENGNMLSISSTYMIPIWIVLLIILYIKIYEVKDLK